MCFLSDRFQVENPETILCKFQFNCGIYSSQMSKLRESRFKWIGRGIEEEPGMRSRMQFCPGWTSCSSDFPKPRQDQACLKGYHPHTLDTSSSVLDSERSLFWRPPASDLQPRHIICTIWFLYHYLVFLNGYQTRNLFLFQLPGFLPVLHGFH